MEKDILKIATQLNSLSMTYDYKDWESILTSDIRDIFKRDVNISSKKKYPWLTIQTITELFEASLFIKLPDVQEISCTVTHMKFSMNRLTGKLIFFLQFFYLIGLKYLFL
jgi:hypothetical protein